MEKNVKNILLVVIMILILIGTILAVSYSYYIIDASTKTYNSNTSTLLPSCAGITLTDTGITGATSVNLTGDYASPIQDDRLLNSSETIISKYRYRFTLTNSCSSSINTKIVLAPTSSNTMPIKAVKYLLVSSGASISGQTTKYVKQASNGYSLNNQVVADIRNMKNKIVSEGYVLSTPSITASSSVTYDLYIWIDYYEGDPTNYTLNNSTINTSLDAMIFATDLSSIGTSLSS